MANVYSQINIHVVFSVSGRDNLLLPHIRKELFPYINGIMKNTGLYPLAVNGWLDHVHAFFEVKPHILLSKSVETIKSNSSKWINERGFIRGKFNWQRGYGIFSYSHSQRDQVIKYIMGQEDHHRKKANTFQKEYMKLLKLFQIEFEEKYVFEFYDDIMSQEI
jgi:putative transposase